ncbi:MAG TPA: sugar ABC transporter permease [Nitrospiria bacterium]|nr:sugar ABC transporter permease [Nitrospiria bacterium]
MARPSGKINVRLFPRSYPYLLTLPALIILGTLAFFPIVNAFWISLHQDTGLGKRRFIGLQNYGDLLGNPEAMGSLEFTLIFVLVSVPAEILIGLMIALVTHHGFRGRGWVRAAVLIPWAIPTVVTSWLWLYIFDGDRGILNFFLFGASTEQYITFLRHTDWARSAIIIADVWKTAPFTALLILAGLQTIPNELHEAARVDGAGPVTRFFRITLPLLRPAILLALLFRSMDAFRVFDLVYVMTRARSDTSVLQYLGYQRLIVETNYGMGSAVSVVVFALIAAASVFYVRMIRTRLLEDGT